MLMRRLAFALLGLAVGLCACSAGRDRQHVLNIYAWAEYFPPALIKAFEQESGLHVNYTVLDSPDTVETALSAGSSDYDLVTMNASPHLAREIPSGFWKKLDYTKIPNAKNADPEILKILARADPGNAYAVPWMWGTVGLMYNEDKIRALIGALPANQIDLLFDPALASKLNSCGISVLDSWQDIMPVAARYLGQKELSADPGALKAVEHKLEETRPSLRRIATTGYYEQIANGELCVALGYSGDAMIARRMARESDTHTQVAYAFPLEAVAVFIDSLVIPAGARNADGAERFINFVMQPERSAEVVRTIGFASGNAAAVPLLEASMRDNPITYPGSAIRARMSMERVYSTDELRIFSRAWQRFKSGQ